MKTRYLVLVEYSSEKLSDLVNKYINDGWTLIGGISVASHFQTTEMSYGHVRNETVRTFAQAMIIQG